jgi:hypothetical protein
MTDPTPQTTPTRDEAVPTGWKLVPVEPTEEMIEAMREAARKASRGGISGMTIDAQFRAEHRPEYASYAAMLASAPAPASGGVDAVAVKALEWSEPNPAANYPEWRARDSNNKFEAVIDTSRANCFGKFPLTINGIDAGEKFDTLAQAKARAQSVYEARIRSALSPAATPVSEAGGERLLRQLRALAVVLHAKHYPDVTQWRPLDDAEGLLSQIDNMTACLTRQSDEADEVARLTAELAAVRAELRRESSARDFAAALAEPASSPAGGVALRALYEWYDRDGSVGGASEVFEKHRSALSQSTSAGRVGG